MVSSNAAPAAKSKRRHYDREGSAQIEASDAVSGLRCCWFQASRPKRHQEARSVHLVYRCRRAIMWREEWGERGSFPTVFLFKILFTSFRKITFALCRSTFSYLLLSFFIILSCHFHPLLLSLWQGFHFLSFSVDCLYPISRFLFFPPPSQLSKSVRPEILVFKLKAPQWTGLNFLSPAFVYFLHFLWQKTCYPRLSHPIEVQP